MTSDAMEVLTGHTVSVGIRDSRVHCVCGWASEPFGTMRPHQLHIAEAVEALVEARVAAALTKQAEGIAAAIEARYLGADFGRSYDGRESPDAALHNAYDEGLNDAARLAREFGQQKEADHG